MITLTYPSGPTLELPEDLYWSDEFDFSPVSQVVTPSLSGALIVESSAQQGGRPITLEGGDQAGWARRSLVETLRTWAAIPGREMTLTLHGGRSFSVLWSYEQQPIEARPVVEYSEPDPLDWYAITLRFIEV